MKDRATSHKGTIYGMLTTHSVEIPFETEEDAKRAEEANESLAAQGVGFRIHHAATDFGFVAHEDTATAILKKQPMTKYLPDQTQPFKKGDLVTVFETVTDGDVFWEGVIDYDRTNYHHGYQNGFEPQKWTTMFYDALPAKLVRKDGSVIFGALEAFAETGTEGAIWSVSEYGKRSYDSLNCLEDGDKLTVYSAVRDGKIAWQGEVKFGQDEIHKMQHWTMMRRVEHMDTEDWLYLSYGHNPIAVMPKRGLKVV